MIHLASLTPDDEHTEESVTVAEAARRLGCDASTVRELVRIGELTGHRVGKSSEPGGIRVHAAAVREYKRRNATGGGETRQVPTPARRTVHNAGAAEARRRLRELGVL